MRIEVLSLSDTYGGAVVANHHGWITFLLNIGNDEHTSSDTPGAETILIHGKVHESTPSYESQSWGVLSSHATLMCRFISREGLIVLEQELSPPDCLRPMGVFSRQVVLKRSVMCPEEAGEYSLEIELNFSSLRPAFSTYGDYWLEEVDLERLLQQKVSARVEGVVVVPSINSTEGDQPEE